MTHAWRRPATFLILSTLMILLGGSLTLLWLVAQGQSSKADGGGVVGPPSLPAATVDTILARVGSPMVGTGKVIEQAASRTHIDDAFALAVWWTETNDGAAGVGRADRNPGSIRGSVGYPAAFDHYTIYPSYSAAIVDWFNVLESRYISRGLTSAYTICYPYVGTSSAAQWAVKVVNLMLRYRSEAPLVVVPTVIQPLSAHNHPLYHPGIADAHQGTSYEGQVAAGKRYHATSDDHTVQAQAPIGLSAANQAMIVGFGLLIAIVIALLSKMVERNALAIPAVAKPTPFGILNAPLGVSNVQFGISNVQSFSGATAPLVAWRPDPQPVPFMPRVESPAVAFAAGGGLLTQHRNTRTIARRIALLPSNGNMEQLPFLNEGERVPTTEALPDHVHVVLPRMLATAGSGSGGGGGLLKRYAQASN